MILFDLLVPPTPQPTIHQFGLIVGERGTINVTVYANPKPQFTWRIGEETIRLGRTDESGRLQTSSEMSLVSSKSSKPIHFKCQN